MENLIIEGFIGSGKGAVGRAVAKRLKIARVDLDKLVSERLKMTSAEIYDKFGESYYRAMETLILDELAENKKRMVIVLGSGAAIMPQNKEYFEKIGRVYYIKRSPLQLLANIKAADERHAWIHGEKWDEQVLKLIKEREPYYKKVADVTIKGNKKTPDEIAEEILIDARDKKRKKSSKS